MAWLDTAIRQRGAKDFLSAASARRSERLDRIAYRHNAKPELARGLEFSTWVRRMTVDAFSSELGITDIDYRGNTPLALYRHRRRRWLSSLRID